MRYALIFVLPGMFLLSSCAFAQQPSVVPYVVTPPEKSEQLVQLPGDRVRSALGAQAAALDAAAAIKISENYSVGPGDRLTVIVRGRVDLNYGSRSAPDEAPVERGTSDTYEVMPDGSLHLPMLAPIQAAGKTVAELRQEVTGALSELFKHFTVDLSVAKPATIRVWVSGEVASPGPQVLGATATVLEALLRADILPTGSTRLIRLTRDGRSSVVDAYSVAARGQLDANVTLQAGDEIHVPAALNWVTVTGEVSRPGRFEMVPCGDDGRFCASDLVDLCLGLLPSAARSHAIVERMAAAGDVQAMHVDLSANDDPELKAGDRLVIPSISDYQPTIRMVGEFKGDGVYQRVAGTVLNKSGVYRLAKGETAGDVITRTGGATPQANFRRARIERRKNGKVEIIPLDLERLLTHHDESADVVLENGDTVVLPALLDKVYVFGQVARPGGIAYEPDRRLLDYVGYAGGSNTRAKSSVIVVRGDPDRPEVLKVDMVQGMKGSEKDNPIMQPGDVVFVPEKVIADWRDIAQIISTVRLLVLF